MFDSILMIGFGGPTPGCCGRRENCARADSSQDQGEEARCFISGILGDNPARLVRVEEIVAHYRALGGYSPYNELTGRQAAALQAELTRRGHALPVYTAFRHWTPWARDVLRRMREAGHDACALCIMSPHQCSVSWDSYIKHVAETRLELGKAAPRITAVVEPWWHHAGFITGLAARIDELRTDWSNDRWQEAALVFSAHAIPQALEKTSPYRDQLAETARLVALQVGHPKHHIGFQSQPDTPGMPWSAPNIFALASQLAAEGASDLVVQAAGFLVDHVEVLYDLDRELRAHCGECGLAYHRAACVHDHPSFIDTLADGIEQQLQRAPVARS